MANNQHVKGAVSGHLDRVLDITNAKPPLPFAALERKLILYHDQRGHASPFEYCPHCQGERAELEAARRLVEAAHEHLKTHHDMREMVYIKYDKLSEALAACQPEGNDAQEK